MSPFALIASLRAAQLRAERVPEAHGMALVEVLEGIARRPVFSRGQQPFVIDPAHTEDLVQEIALRLLNNAEKPFDAVVSHPELAPLRDPEREAEVSDELRAQADRITVGYLRSMLANRAMDQRRRSRRLVHGPPPEEPTRPEDLDVELIEQIRADLGRLVERAASTMRRAPEREAFRASVEQLMALSDEAVEFEALVHTELGSRATGVGPVDAGEYKAAADRLYKRHERARERLAVTLDDGGAGLDLSPARRHALRQVVRLYLRRCQRRDDGDVSRASGAARGPRGVKDHDHD